MRPCQLSTIYASSHLDEEPSLSTPSKAPKRPPKTHTQRITKNHLAAKKPAKPPAPSPFNPSTLPNAS